MGFDTPDTFGERVEAWAVHVARIARERDIDQDDPFRWSADDFVAALFVRDRLQSALAHLRVERSEPAIVEVIDAFFVSVCEPIDSLLFLEWDAPEGPWWWKLVPAYGPIRNEIDERKSRVQPRVVSDDTRRWLSIMSAPTPVSNWLDWLTERGFLPTSIADREDDAIHLYRSDGMRALVRLRPEGWELLVGPPVAAGEVFSASEWATVLGVQFKSTDADECARFFIAEWSRVKALSTLPATAVRLRGAA